MDKPKTMFLIPKENCEHPEECRKVAEGAAWRGDGASSKAFRVPAVFVVCIRCGYKEEV